MDSRVFVVVEREFGDRLATIPSGVPVWIIDTPSNRHAAQLLRQDRTATSHLDGITTFKDHEKLAPEALFRGILETVDLHHGPYSSDPAYDRLEVVGCPLDGTVQDALKEFSLSVVRENDDGFTAGRLKETVA